MLDLASTQAGTYDETDQEILSSLGNTLGAIIANTQLVGEVRQQVERQRMLYDITSRIRRTTRCPDYPGNFGTGNCQIFGGKTRPY